MSDNGKVKIYKNPLRGVPEKRQQYVPEYKQHNIEPVVYKPTTMLFQKPSQTTPSGPSRVIQPYQIPGSAIINELPNVGNNFEQTWGSVDGQIIDDVGIDLDLPLIDNNDFVSFDEVEEDASEDSDATSIISSLSDNEYLLFVQNHPFLSGNSEMIKSEIYKLLIESDISIDDIMVIKKVKTTFGITLD